MRTLEEIDLKILDTAHFSSDKPFYWHDPAFAKSLELLGAKYREMYSILVDLNNFLNFDQNCNIPNDKKASELKDDLRKQLANL